MSYADMVANRKKDTGVPRNEMFIILGFGDDVAPDKESGKKLKELGNLYSG